ncbi:hypothetical protein KRR38_01875 [Novosphingobium sp. G106]|nr:hypothetical protein [Novosphingobium sp. G106]
MRISEAWRKAVGPPGLEERKLLELTDEFGPGSRLSCQIQIRMAIDGLQVSVLP